MSTPLIRWLRAAQTRRMFARALGGGERPNDTYLSMATDVLDKVATEVGAKPWTNALLPEPGSGTPDEPSTTRWHMLDEIDKAMMEEAEREDTAWHYEAVMIFRRIAERMRHE